MILALQERKRSLMREAIESEQDGIKALDRGDLMRIFGDGGDILDEQVSLDLESPRDDRFAAH